MYRSSYTGTCLFPTRVPGMLGSEFRMLGRSDVVDIDICFFVGHEAFALLCCSARGVSVGSSG